MDQRTIAAMMALTQITGERKYADFAMTCLKYYTSQLVDARGFLWWGWHRHYDAHRDVMTGHQGEHHEVHIQKIIWPILWQANPEAVEREIEAIWRWHIIDKETGECNRHGDGQPGCDFAMSGGEFLRAFAFLYHKTGAEKWLERARLIAKYYWDRRDQQTDLFPNRPNAGTERFDGSHFDTSITGPYCMSLLDAHRWTGVSMFRAHALANLHAFAKYGYDDKTKQFWGSLELDGTPVPGPRLQRGYAAYEPRGPIDILRPYVAGYEFPLSTAQSYAIATRLTSDPALLGTALRWADSVRWVFPADGCDENSWYGQYARNEARHGTYAGLYGRAVTFFLQMYSITGDAAYGEFAAKIADEAIVKLYYNGLFRGHPSKPYYEATDGVGYLLYSLLQLHDARLAAPSGALTFENL